MSIYDTLWTLKFPSLGVAYRGCEWETVLARYVPSHVGTPTQGHGYEDGDPYSSFLPPAVPVNDDDETECPFRAVIIIREQTKKIGQQYIGPLLVLSGAEYEASSFDELHERICDALRASGPRIGKQSY
jgi:hypothetical protein